MNLNEAQKRAVEHQGGHLLIVAGPGTGKTHTLTCRMANLAQQLKTNEGILAITFTNKAAFEMKERLEERCPEKMNQMFVGTFHQFCLSLLRRFCQETNLPQDFRVAEPEEIESLVKSLWPQESNSRRQEMLKKISQKKAVLQNEELPSFFEEYNRYLRQNGLLDFDDLLLEAVYLLKAKESVRQKVQSAYRLIFVDEYQDINPAQRALLKILIKEGNYLTAIGDPNQAIYGFRGSDVRFFETFKDDFPNAVILSLNENYRCAANLLRASSQVMEKSKSIFVPEITAKIYREGRLTVYEAPTEKAEAEYVVHQIEKLVGGTSMFSQDSGRVGRDEEGKYGFGDIAVLYRLNALRYSLQEALERSGIPYQISGQNDYPSDDEDYELHADKVSLLTMHASKGLEFSVVFILGCEENLLPLKLDGLASDLEEERRLFYVGMTRSKERLYLISSKRRFLFGRIFQNPPSWFLKDIEENLKQHEQEKFYAKQRKPLDTQLSLFDIKA